jgi:hypothetical protein
MVENGNLGASCFMPIHFNYWQHFSYILWSSRTFMTIHFCQKDTIKKSCKKFHYVKRFKVKRTCEKMYVFYCQIIIKETHVPFYQHLHIFTLGDVRYIQISHAHDNLNILNPRFINNALMIVWSLTYQCCPFVGSCMVHI